MKPTRTTFFRLLKLLLFLGGATLLYVMIVRLDPATLWNQICVVRYGILLILIYPVLWTILNTLGWRAAVGSDNPVPFSRMLVVRQAGEAVNYVVPSGYMGGEPFKAWFIKSDLPLTRGIASIVVAKTTQTIAQVLFFVLGLVFALLLLKLDMVKQLVLISVICGIGGGTLIFAVIQQKGFFGMVMNLSRRFNAGGRLRSMFEEKAEIVDQSIQRLYREDRRYLVMSIAFHFCGWLLGIGEIYIIMYFLNGQVTLAQSFFIATLTSIISASGFFIPGSVGAYEGGHVVVFKLMGMDPSTGLALGLLRRVRELSWVALGLILFTLLGGRKLSVNSSSTTEVVTDELS